MALIPGGRDFHAYIRSLISSALSEDGAPAFALVNAGPMPTAESVAVEWVGTYDEHDNEEVIVHIFGSFTSAGDPDPALRAAALFFHNAVQEAHDTWIYDNVRARRGVYRSNTEVTPTVMPGRSLWEATFPVREA